MVSTKNPAKAGTTERIPLAALRLYDRNPRKGNVATIAASLRAHTQYRPIVVNIGTHTERPAEVLAGNHTLKAFRLLAKRHPDEEQWGSILVHWVDVDEDQAAAIVLADNKTSESGHYDNGDLSSLLSDVSHDLTGLGFTAEDLAAMNPPTIEIDPDDYGDDEDQGNSHGPGRGTAVIAYSIVFDTQEQRREWANFMSWLKRRNPDSTPGERLTDYLEEHASRALQETEEQ